MPKSRDTLTPAMVADPAGLAQLAFDGWQLSFDMAMVIWLRSIRFAAGGKGAEGEGRRMVSEKVEAGATLLTAMWGDGLDWTPQGAAMRALSHYAGPVRANRRRLSKTA